MRSTTYNRDFGCVFFDCTNYYFEIDLPREDKQKGPSKENRHEPIIGQALLLDADLVPLGMQMYPGNESEKPYIRRTIEEMKQRYRVSGKTVQVADKGLNCAGTSMPLSEKRMTAISFPNLYTGKPSAGPKRTGSCSKTMQMYSLTILMKRAIPGSGSNPAWIRSLTVSRRRIRRQGKRL